jgi:DNA-binding transcriptional LysR family regulator
MGITIKQLEAFVHVADLGGFNRAAERLGTTQPNISARIAALEGLLGVTLMERDPGSGRLTPRGSEMLVQARRVLSALDALKTGAENASLIDGVLRLGVTELVAHTWLRAFLDAMRQRFPKVAVELSVDLSVNVERDLMARSIDLAFHNAPFLREVDGARDLGSWPLTWVAAPGTVAPTAKTLAVGSLASQTIITHSRGARVHDEIAGHFSQVGHPAQGLVSSSNLAVCLQMALAGFGIAAVPEAMAGDALSQGTLMRVPYSWTPAPLAFQARFETERSPGHVQSAADIAADVARRDNQLL